MEATPMPPPAPMVQVPHLSIADADLNKITMNIHGDKVMVSGLFDLKGLRLLEKKIVGLKAIMDTDEDGDA